MRRPLALMRVWLCRLFGHKWGPWGMLFAGMRVAGAVRECCRCGACQDTVEPMQIDKAL